MSKSAPMPPAPKPPPPEPRVFRCERCGSTTHANYSADDGRTWWCAGHAPATMAHLIPAAARARGAQA